MTQLALDLSASLRARDAGIKLAAEHAGDDWMARAVADFVAFLREHGPAPLESWRYDWLTRRNAPPASHKAYGAVAATALRRGLIRWTGQYKPAASKKTHGHPVRVLAAVQQG